MMPSPSNASATSRISLVVATIGAMLYVVASWYLLTNFAGQTVDEKTWQRALIIFNGIASVGFACFGVLLGSSVQQVSLSEARADAKNKGEAIKDAMDKLNAPIATGPGDLGGGPASEETRKREAYEILRKAL